MDSEEAGQILKEYNNLRKSRSFKDLHRINNRLESLEQKILDLTILVRLMAERKEDVKFEEMKRLFEEARGKALD